MLLHPECGGKPECDAALHGAAAPRIDKPLTLTRLFYHLPPCCSTRGHPGLLLLGLPGVSHREDLAVAPLVDHCFLLFTAGGILPSSWFFIPTVLEFLPGGSWTLSAPSQKVNIAARLTGCSWRPGS